MSGKQMSSKRAFKRNHIVMIPIYDKKNLTVDGEPSIIGYRSMRKTKQGKLIEIKRSII